MANPYCLFRMWQYLLHRFLGIGEAPDAVRFGVGVVGHTTRVMLAVIAGAVAICFALADHAYFAFAVIILLIVLVVLYLLGTWHFAGKHPDQAAMGDTVWLKYRQFEAERKNAGSVTSLPPQSDPQKQLPNIIDHDQISGPEEGEAEN
jgi:hypothetical protein